MEEYATYHQDNIAVLVCKDGRLLRIYKGGSFPFIQPSIGGSVPTGSLYHKVRRSPGEATDIEDCIADIWLDVERGTPAPKVSEQVLWQQEGFAMLLLSVEVPDEDEEDEDGIVKRSWYLSR